MIYEIEIVTFSKIRIIALALVLMSMFYSSEGRRKDKTRNKGENEIINPNSSLKLM